VVRWLAYWILMLWAQLSLADMAELHVLGFSTDAKYFAYQQYGITAGEGAAFAELYIVEVQANRQARAPIIHRNADDRQLNAVRQQNLQQAQTLLRQYGITNAGELLVSRLPHDLSVEPHKVSFAVGKPLINAPKQIYSLNLSQKLSSVDCGDIGYGRIFTLKLTNEATGQSIELHSDRNLPSERGCPIRYRIQDVYVYNEHVAIVLNLFQLGYEGDRMRYMLVTGKLNN
jgi:predicted secreted protein